MPIPEFVQELRAVAGHHKLWLTTSNAVVFRLERGHDASAAQVLMVLHKERKAWSLPGGICDIGEHPAATAVRECAEETGITPIPIRLAAVTVSPSVTYSNGDHAQYTELWYQCAIGSSDENTIPQIADDESDAVMWCKLTALPSPLSPNVRHVIERAASGDVCTLDLSCNIADSMEVHPGVIITRDPLQAIRGKSGILVSTREDHQSLHDSNTPHVHLER